jgi:folate-binding protein YgfZ
MEQQTGFPMNQYAAFTADAGFVDLGNRTQVEIAGDDRAALLNNFCTNDIKRLTPGAGCEAFLTSGKGRVLAHVQIFRGESSLILETVPGQAAAIIEHLERYVVREDVQFVDRTESFSEILLGGSESEVEAKLNELGCASLPVETLHHATNVVANVAVSFRRTEMVTPRGLLLSFPAESIVTVAEALENAGFVRCEPTVFETCRIEAGWPEYGIDITIQNFPQEVGRDDRAISFTKGCYLGQETVARIDALGHVNKQLVRVKFESSDPPVAGMEITCDGQSAGHVTSSAYSPAHEAALAFAYARSQFTKPGTVVDAEIGPAIIQSALR